MKKYFRNMRREERRLMRSRASLFTTVKFFGKEINTGVFTRYFVGVVAGVSGILAILSLVFLLPDYAFPTQTNNYPTKTEIIRTDTPSLRIVTPPSEISKQLISIKDEIYLLEYRLSNIENVIVDNPEKSVELISLRMDLDELTRKYEADSIDIQRSIDRIYTLTFTFIFPMFLTVCGLAITIFINTKKPDTKKE